MVRTFKMYSLSSFQIYSPVLSTTVTMLHMTPPWPIYFRTGRLYILTPQMLRILILAVITWLHAFLQALRTDAQRGVLLCVNCTSSNAGERAAPPGHVTWGRWPKSLWAAVSWSVEWGQKKLRDCKESAEGTPLGSTWKVSRSIQILGTGNGPRAREAAGHTTHPLWQTGDLRPMSACKNDQLERNSYTAWALWGAWRCLAQAHALLRRGDRRQICPSFRGEGDS